MVAVDSLPKDSTVELQLYAEETGCADLAEAEGAGAPGSLLLQASAKLLAAEEPRRGTVVAEIGGRVAKHCVVHVALRLPSTDAFEQLGDRAWIGTALQALCQAAGGLLLRAGLGISDCVCARLFRHASCAPQPGELAAATRSAWGAGGSDVTIVEVGTLHRGTPMALHVVAARGGEQLT